MDINIFISASGQRLHNAPQQQWRGDEIMETAMFGGQMMTLGGCEDGTDGFELIYLGFKSNRFYTLEDAKSAAPKFATIVLQGMIGLVQIYDRTKPNPFAEISPETLARWMADSLNNRLTWKEEMEQQMELMKRLGLISDETDSFA